MFKLLTISCLLLLTHTHSLSAATIKNQINIKTNTGGNTVNGQTDGESVTTGDTSTTISIQNDESTLTIDDSKQTTDTKTSISIESTGNGESAVEIAINNISYEISSEDGVTKVTTETADGKKTTETLEKGSVYKLVYQDGSSLELLSDDKGFNLTQEDAHISTTIPLTVNTEEKIVTTTDDNIEVSLLPLKAKERFLEKFTDLSDMILLVRNDTGLVYTAEGYSQQKILGLLDTKIYFNGTQSATQVDSRIEFTHASFNDKLIDVLSF